MSVIENMSTSEVIDPCSDEAYYRGELLEIHPLTIGKIPRIVKLAKPIFNSISSGSGDEKGDDIDLILTAISDHGDAMIDAAALAVDKPRDWIAEGNADEFLGLAIKIIKINRDFFSKRVTARLPALGKNLMRDGQTSSSA